MKNSAEEIVSTYTSGNRKADVVALNEGYSGYNIDCYVDGFLSLNFYSENQVQSLANNIASNWVNDIDQPPLSYYL